MRDYLEQILHQTIEKRPFAEANLPLACRKAFVLNTIMIGDLGFLLAEPRRDMNLKELRSMRVQLERHSQFQCAFFLKRLNWYSAPKMVEEGIPFVWEGHQVYLPFLGLALTEKPTRIIKPCSEISFLTQKLLIKALYENWQNLSAAQVAEKMDVARMSITRCFDEMESLGISLITNDNSKRRKISVSGSREETWNMIKPHLRNPIIRTFRLAQHLDGVSILSGLSALSEYSLLDDGPVRTYAVQKSRIGELGLSRMREVPAGEEPACIIHEVGYILPYGNNTAVDPLSLTLMLTESELDDPRVQAGMKEMLEERVW